MKVHKDIWIPHIPKNGGLSIIQSITNYCLTNRDKFESNIVESRSGWLDEETIDDIAKKYKENNEQIKKITDNWISKGKIFQFRQFKNKDTGSVIKLHHENPLEIEMEDWLKILIIREPISRFVSYFNYFKFNLWDEHKALCIKTFDEFIESQKHESFVSHIDWLNSRQFDQIRHITQKTPRILEEFTIDTVRDIFDYIIDVSNLNKVFSIIEEHFLQTEIEWKIYNSAKQNFDILNKEQNEYKFAVFKKEDITESQMAKLLNLPSIKNELKFYNSIKVKKRLDFDK